MTGIHQSYVCVRKIGAPGRQTTQFLHLDSKGRPTHGCARIMATEFPTWRKAHNAAVKHGYLTSPATSYPVETAAA